MLNYACKERKKKNQDIELCDFMQKLLKMLNAK